MSFSKDLRMAAEPIIEDIYNDGFIQDLLHGELSKQAVRQYLRADASYLINEAKISCASTSPSNKNSICSTKNLTSSILGTLGINSAYRILASFINEPYHEIVKEKVWPPSGDHYIKHMYYNAYAYENAA
jgi:thiaminase/transcriptional activator TenA